MTKSKLLQRIHDRLSHQRPGFSHKDIEAGVNVLINHMSETLAKGGHVEVRGFGSFTIHHLDAFIGRNPKSGENVLVRRKQKVHFKPGLMMRKNVNAAMKKKKRDVITKKLRKKKKKAI